MGLDLTGRQLPKSHLRGDTRITGTHDTLCHQTPSRVVSFQPDYHHISKSDSNTLRVDPCNALLGNEASSFRATGLAGGHGAPIGLPPCDLAQMTYFAHTLSLVAKGIWGQDHGEQRHTEYAHTHYALMMTDHIQCRTQLKPSMYRGGGSGAKSNWRGKLGGKPH